ncbi:MAG: hypothetical protein NC120_09295, partial [Ruminococcus sp.]|nr:hypothetical protein [Ruminococcus sp.]
MEQNSIKLTSADDNDKEVNIISLTSVDDAISFFTQPPFCNMTTEQILDIAIKTAYYDDIYSYNMISIIIPYYLISGFLAALKRINKIDKFTFKTEPNYEGDYEIIISHNSNEDEPNHIYECSANINTISSETCDFPNGVFLVHIDVRANVFEKVQTNKFNKIIA